MTHEFLADSDIRAQLRRVIEPAARRFGAAVLEELGLRCHQARVDLAAVDHAIRGYEIKSDLDGLRRLPHQIAVYSQVLDRVTVVAAVCHLERIIGLVPAWWGVVAAVPRCGTLAFRQHRPGGRNPDVNPRAQAELIWRDAAIQLLEARNAARGYRGKPRHAVWDHLCDVYTSSEVASLAREHLRARSELTAVRRQSPGDALLREGGV